MLAPSIIEKVERNGAKRGSLAKYLRILMQIDEPRCFYCDRSLDAAGTPQVEHVIPWSFLLSDPLADAPGRHDLSPPYRVREHGDHYGAAAEPAVPTLEGSSPQRHRDFCPGRIARLGVGVAEAGRIAAPDRKGAGMVLAPPADRGGVAGPTVAPARTRAAPAPWRPAGEVERKGRGGPRSSSS